MALGVDGLVSGLDTTSIISGLMAVESRPKTLLQNQITVAQAKASAYRAVNTRFDAIRTAAEALTSASLQAAKTASSSSASLTASASSSASTGRVTFTVLQLASTQEVMSERVFTSATASVTDDGVRPSWPIQVLDAEGRVTDTIVVPAGSSLADVAELISASGYGLDATVVQVGNGEFRLKVVADSEGSAGAFRIGLTGEDGSPDELAFRQTSPAQGAIVDLGGGIRASSASNTFENLIPGTRITVSKLESAVTVTVGSDDAAITAKVQALVDAANGALGVSKGYTTSTAGQATATLQGDRALVQLSDQVLSAISSAIGGKSASTIGLQLTRDGKVTFDAAAFTAKLGSDPAAVTALLSGTDTTTGIAGKLAALAKTASDSSTGTLVQLATGRDTLAKAIQEKVDAFDIRLAARQATLTRQFGALETALSTIKNQSSWLSSQIGQLYDPNAS
ncbi:MAG: Flagellar hook-associated protein 2 [Klenkia sp.]|nr:Flagellar hook-associated protein 2 [Klenkia sp.]